MRMFSQFRDAHPSAKRGQRFSEFPGEVFGGVPPLAATLLRVRALDSAPLLVRSSLRAGEDDTLRRLVPFYKGTCGGSAQPGASPRPAPVYAGSESDTNGTQTTHISILFFRFRHQRRT